jgi:hypothetical protein
VAKVKAKWIILVIVVVASFIGLVYFFGLGGAIAGLFESLAVFALSNPDKASEYLGSIYKQLRTVNFWFEKKAVEKRLEGAIGLASKKVNSEGVNLLPHGVNIRWVETKDREAFLKDDKIVVCFEPSINEERNLARATMLYTSEDLIRESQRFVNRGVIRAACLAVARKMLMIERRLDALKCLNEEFLQPEIAQHPSIEEYIETMGKLDSEGNFTRVLLNELSELDTKLLSALSDPRAESETISFMQAMKRLAEKKEGIDVDTDHRGQVIDYRMILIAREGVKDPSRYINYAKRRWGEGVPKIYVLAQGDRTITAIAAVLGIKAMGLYRVEKEWKFKLTDKHGSFNAYTAVLFRIQA